MIALGFNDREEPSRFARGPAEALDLLIQLRQTTDTLDRRFKDPTIDPAVIQVVRGTREDWQDWRSMLVDLPVYFWKPELVTLVDEAAKTYPLKDEEVVSVRDIERAQSEGRTLPPPTYFPRIARALCVFAAPNLGAQYSGKHKAFSGLLWQVGYAVKKQEFWICIRGISWSSRESHAWPVWLSDGGSEHLDKSLSRFGPDITAEDKATQHAEQLHLIRWICTASMFVEQDILAADPAPIHSSAIKYAAGQLKHEPKCLVVTLRHQSAEAGAAPSQDNAIDWACRWVVRGHWRRQWFPKRDTHAPVWIHPYVKGPEDRPFKPEKPVVYSVSR